MKPRLLAQLITEEDSLAWRSARISWMRQSGDSGANLRVFSRECDRSDADLMLGLGARRCEATDVCTAELFEVGCVISSLEGGRIAKRAASWKEIWADPRDDITYFA
jgi:hypothetical protein